MFQNSSEYSFHLKSYPAACFHLDDAEYLRRRNEMLEFLFSNFGINRKMLIRLILAYPKFFNNEVEEISTKLELLKNLYVSMGGKNFKVFGRTQLGIGFSTESFVSKKVRQLLNNTSEKQVIIKIYLLFAVFIGNELLSFHQDYSLMNRK